MNQPPENFHRRILVIDDNRAIHDDFRKILCARANDEAIRSIEAELFNEPSLAAPQICCEIDSAFQGKDGLELVEKAIAAGRPYSMAFVDVRMPPGWDGIETIGRIWEKCSDLQTVVCTAYSDYSWDEMHEKLGISDRLVILKKPFDNIEVLQLARALTEKWRLLQETRSNVSELEGKVAQRTEQLRKSEEHFRLITENAVDLIAILDDQGKRLYTSPSYQRLLGCSAEELSGTSAFEQIHADDRQRVVASVHHTIQSAQGQVIEFRVQHKDGAWRTLEAHATPFRNAASVIEGVLIVARDINERKTLELQLRQAQKLESIGQLAAGIAHEINTPTQFIGDNTRFVRDAFNDLRKLFTANDQLLQAARTATVTPELIQAAENARSAADLDYLLTEVPKAIEQTIDGVERVTKIVRAMKEFSHPGTDQKTMLDINHAIESTATVCHSQWKYVAELVTDFDSTLPSVPVLPGEFNQVVLNLIINASHAIADVVGENGSKGKGTITVSTRGDGEWAEVRIRDSGTGIPEKVRERLFEPFFTTKEVGKGTGQGLAIARSVIVDKHGGTIHFETELGSGTCFVLRLPLKDSAEHSEAA